jgi:outer membrane protein insertion porin family
LQNAISEVAVGTGYSEDHFRQLLDNAIRPLYERQGRLRVSFPKIAVEPAKDVQGLDVQVTVDDGPVFMLGNVRLDGLLSVKPEELMKIGAFKTGKQANLDEAALCIDRIKKRLRRQGYMRVDIRPERHLNDEKKIVDMTLHIDEGPQFLMGRLKIEGLDIYTEPPIRKAWGLPEGKPFDTDYPDAFLNRLREEQVFENLKNTRSKSDVNEQAHTVDVTLYFQ